MMRERPGIHWCSHDHVCGGTGGTPALAEALLNVGQSLKPKVPPSFGWNDTWLDMPCAWSGDCPACSDGLLPMCSAAAC